MVVDVKDASRRLGRLAAIILSSVLFLPVSCGTGLIAGTHFIAHIEARDSQRGESPHRGAYLVAVLPGVSPRLEGIPWVDLEEFKKANPHASFLLSEKEGQFRLGQRGATVSFVATPGKRPGAQQIAVSMRDDTSSFFRYEATRDAISPQYSRLFYHGYMFSAAPYAILLAVSLYFLGLRMQRKLQTPQM